MRLRSFIILIAAVAVVGLAGQAYAFHDGGVAECAGCHSMHSSEGIHLLVAGDQSSTCLACHESVGDTGPTRYHISTPAAELALDTDIVVQRTPGGDFGWLRQDLSATATYYAPISNYGYERGHNIVAVDNAYVVDPDNGTAPGGTMPANQLGCQSCHDPHGQARIIDNGGTYQVQFPTIGATHDPIFDSGSYFGDFPAAGEAVGVYRLLGSGFYTAWDAVQYPGAPAARVDGTYNRSETKAAPTRVSYGYSQANGFTSWGRWCATCHPGMHESDASNAPSGLVHPTDQALGSQANVYNAYVMTGDLTGTSTDSFTSLVPFTKNTADLTALDTAGATVEGPIGGDRMNCLTCHRAHASGWKYIMRWNNEAEFLTLGGAGAPVYPGVDAGLGNQGQFNRGYTVAQMAATYNDRPAGDEFNAHQRVLCNKCHMKD